MPHPAAPDLATGLGFSSYQSGLPIGGLAIFFLKGVGLYKLFEQAN